MWSRRKFVQHTSAATSALMMPALGKCEDKKPLAEQRLKYYIFSKHLQFLEYRDMADAAAQLGFDGVDLTVRPKGHVIPERVNEDLPKAVDAIKAAGLRPDMMASGVNNAEDPVNREVLETAAKVGIQFYRLSYLRFNEDKPIPEDISLFNKQLKNLAALNRSLGITGAYQNHAGTRVGAAIWDIHQVLQDIKTDEIGCQYDIRHAVVEGGASWETGLRLIEPKINCIVLKDFVWAKENGQWKIKNVPLGTGMVDFAKYFALLKKMNINVPVSTHYEYALEGVEHGARELAANKHKVVFDAMKRDLDYAKKMWSSTSIDSLK